MQQVDLGDALGVVAHPLEVGHDVDDRGDDPQVARHRLLGGEETNDCLLDLELQTVNVRVSRDHRAGFVDVPLEHRLHGCRERGLRVTGHIEQCDLELRELVVEMAVARRLRVQPNLPVI